jgi:hypothetical protein
MDPGRAEPSWRSGNTHGFCATGGLRPIASEPTPSPRLWATPPGATPARLCEHTMRVVNRPHRPELFYFAPTKAQHWGHRRSKDQPWRRCHGVDEVQALRVALRVHHHRAAPTLRYQTPAAVKSPIRAAGDPRYAAWAGPQTPRAIRFPARCTGRSIHDVADAPLFNIERPAPDPRSRFWPHWLSRGQHPSHTRIHIPPETLLPH